MSFAIDVAVLVLLIGTLAYAWLVDRRVRRLMQVLREVEPMIGSFSEAVDRTESTVSALRAARDAGPARKRAEPRVAVKPAAQPAPEPAAPSPRDAAPRPGAGTPIAGKSELIRGFFDTVREREA